MTDAVITDSGELRYQPQGEVIGQFHVAPQPVRCLLGPLGSAKTNACIVEILDHIFNQTPDVNNIRWTRVVCVRNTLPDLQTTTITDFKQVCGDMLKYGTFTNGTPPTWRGRFERADDGSFCDFEVLFLAFDLDTDAKKARGLQLSGAWANEASELSRSNIDMIHSRIGRFPPKALVPDSKKIFILDTNMPDRDHWLVKLAYEVKPKSWWFGIQPPAVFKVGGEWRVNPNAENIQNLADDYYENLVEAKPEQWIQRFLENRPVYLADGRPVHPDFNENTHVRQLKPTPAIPLVVGIDFGRTPAAVICQQQHNGCWYVLDEICTDNMGALEFGPLLDKFLNKSYAGFAVTFFADPAGNQHSQTDSMTPFIILERAGIFATPTETNDFEKRTAVLDDQLRQLIGGSPAFLIDPRCLTCIKGMAGAYMFKRVRISGEERYHDQPIKDATSHVVEALHYAMLGSGMGDHLWFSDEWQQEFDEVDAWHPPKAQFV